MLLTLDTSRYSRSVLALASIHSFSFFLRHGLCRKFVGMPRYDRKDVGYCNMYIGNGEEDTLWVK